MDIAHRKTTFEDAFDVIVGLASMITICVCVARWFHRVDAGVGLFAAIWFWMIVIKGKASK